MPYKRGTKRILGQYDLGVPGPLFIAIGGIHGNEPAGVRAIQLLAKMLEVEHITNPTFTFQGRFLGLIGNRRAAIEKSRYIDKDLNRVWKANTLALWQANKNTPPFHEAIEALDILATIRRVIKRHRPNFMVILDLHTTSSGAGIFAVPTDRTDSKSMARQLHAPVIKGMLRGVTGTLLHFFDGSFEGIPTTAVSFEGGQHEDPLSVNRCVAALINVLRASGMVDAHAVENIHDQLLITHAKGLPLETSLAYKHSITPGDQFVMLPGFINFQPIKKGQLVAHDRKGPIYAPLDGYILMPLYQRQGGEGFFIVI